MASSELPHKKELWKKWVAGPAGAALVSPGWQALGYLLAIAVAEALTTLIAPRAGLILYGLTLIGLLLHAALASRDRQQRFLLSLALAPLIRLLNLSIPLQHFPPIYWYAVIGGPLFLAALLAARSFKMQARTLGLNGRGLPVQLAIGLTGAGIGYIEYLILQPEPLAAGFRWELLWLPALVLLVFTGFLEELIFRGLMQHTAVRALGGAGMLYVAVLFAVLHLGYRSVLDLAFVFGVALFFGWAASKTSSILGVSLAHGLTNITLFLVFPFLLSGPAPMVPVTSGESGAVRMGIEAIAPINSIGKPAGRKAAGSAADDKTTPFLPASPTHTPAAPFSSSTVSATASLPPPGYTPSPTQETAATPGSLTTPAAEAGPQQCQPPSGWVVYIVQPGDTLWRLCRAAGIRLSELLEANCIRSADPIFVGQRLYLPCLPAPRQPTSTPKLLPTATPPATPTPAPPTATPPLPPTARDTPVPESPTLPPTPTTPPPTQTAEPPTDTSPPPTETEPPTQTPEPPTATSPPPPEPSTIFPTQTQDPMILTPTETTPPAGTGVSMMAASNEETGLEALMEMASGIFRRRKDSKE